MKSKIVIEIEGSSRCHPKLDELKDISENLKWVLLGKFCDDQEVSFFAIQEN